MFLPKTSNENQAKKKADKLRKEAYIQIEKWTEAAIPLNIRKDVIVNVQEVQCGDPNCSPIDTVLTILFPSGGRGMIALPFEAADVTELRFKTFFPKDDILRAWERGEDVILPKNTDGFSQNEMDVEAKQKADKLRKEAYTRIKKWAVAAVPANIREDVFINVQEVQCGDPECAPIDTIVTILFPSGGRGMMGLPFEAANVTEKLLLEGFPTEEVLAAWERGEEADWPPEDEEPDHDEDTNLPTLRFDLGQKVDCRIGPDPVTGWASGVVTELWYREETWPEGSFAPYKVQLDDGRAIFAPGDIDQVIRSK